ncbi:MAG: rhodanese-like domain-containing protein [Chloroflexota bacterium]|jgi:rhodanese-related sulfurtransferase
MPNIYGAPEIGVEDVAQMRQREEDFILLDVREQMELRLANLGQDVLWIPLSDLAARREEALTDAFDDKDVTVVVFCHTGMRSAQVTAWLRQLGWQNAVSMAGGIEAYALKIEPEVGRY